MNNIEKESLLYNTVFNTTGDKEFAVSFYTYFEFVMFGDGKELMLYLTDRINQRLQEDEEIKVIEENLIKSIKETTNSLEKLIKKHKLEDDEVIKDSLQSLYSFLNGNVIRIGAESNYFDDIELEIRDILRRLIEFGFEKEVAVYALVSNKQIKDVFATKDKADYISKKETLARKDARTAEGALFKLFNLFIQIQRVESVSNANKQKIDNDLGKKIKDTLVGADYGQLISGKTNTSTFFKKEEYMPHLERLHNSIITNNEEIKTSGKEIFYVKDDGIYHYEIGRLNYSKRGLHDPKYIKMFRNIITYMPNNTNKIRVKNLEELIPKQERVGGNYRNNLGQNAKAFNNFLKQQGVQNIHPKTKQKVLRVTDDYVTFNNKL